MFVRRGGRPSAARCDPRKSLTNSQMCDKIFLGKRISNKKHNRNSQTADSADAPIQCRTRSTCRILVVEDEPDIRSLNAEVLKNSGYEGGHC
jgi:PleD family two-component response regulator